MRLIDSRLQTHHDQQCMPLTRSRVMTDAVQQVLDLFDALADAEKQKAAAEILRRVLPTLPPEVPEEALVAAAEQLFLELDAGE